MGGGQRQTLITWLQGGKWKSLSRVRLYVTPWNSPGQNTGVGSLSLLREIFPTQGSNPGLPHCRWILYQLNHKGSPRRHAIGFWVEKGVILCVFFVFLFVFCFLFFFLLYHAACGVLISRPRIKPVPPGLPWGSSKKKTFGWALGDLFWISSAPQPDLTCDCSPVHGFWSFLLIFLQTCWGDLCLCTMHYPLTCSSFWSFICLEILDSPLCNWHLVPSLQGKYMGKEWKQEQSLFSWAPKSHGWWLQPWN